MLRSIAPSAGNYNLKLTIKNNLGDSVEAIKPIVLKIGTVDVNQFSNGKNVSVYPNPNNGLLNIQLDDYENSALEIYNSVGENILSENLQNNFTVIDVSSFAKGIYQMRIMRSRKIIFTGKVMKN